MEIYLIINSLNFKIPLLLLDWPIKCLECETLYRNYDEFTYTLVNFLTDTKVCVCGFGNSQTIRDYCQKAGAELIDNEVGHNVDYLIVPTNKMHLNDINVVSKEIVNDNWLVSGLDNIFSLCIYIYFFLYEFIFLLRMLLENVMIFNALNIIINQLLLPTMQNRYKIRLSP